jgi:hypothetical protein
VKFDSSRLKAPDEMENRVCFRGSGKTLNVKEEKYSPSNVAPSDEEINGSPFGCVISDKSRIMWENVREATFEKQIPSLTSREREKGPSIDSASDSTVRERELE